jgi:exopolysaccharide biosynthesis WecB/TagA/CpsF family protein
MSGFYIEDEVKELRNNRFITLNLEIYYLLSTNKEYLERTKDWSFVCDSRIIQYYLYLVYNRKVVINQGHRLIHKFIAGGMNKFLFLGSIEENLSLSSQNIRKQYSNIKIDTDPLTLFDIKNLLDFEVDLNSKYDFNNYDAIFVALGAPKQDFFISGIETNSLIFGCGGTFEFLSNKVPYPPKIIEFIGLTFVWRLYSDFSISRLKKIIRSFKGAVYLIIRRDIR